LACLVSGLSVGDTAEECGVSRRTLSRWLHKDATFQAALEQARQDQEDARQSLREMVKGGGKISMARFKACCVVLGISENEVRGSSTPAEANRAMRKFLGDADASIPPEDDGWGSLKTK
jgi:hypothetical protein